MTYLNTHHHFELEIELITLVLVETLQSYVRSKVRSIQAWNYAYMFPREHRRASRKDFSKFQRK